MRKRMLAFAVAGLALAANGRPVARVSGPIRAQAPVGPRVAGQPVNTRLVAARVARLLRARDALRRAAAAPLPRKLSPADRAEAERYNQWMRKTANRLDALARRGQALLRSAATAKSTAAQRRMTEMNQSFNMQYVMLQNKMQEENREFTLLSNIMKTKHDTAKNAIKNVR